MLKLPTPPLSDPTIRSCRKGASSLLLLTFILWAPIVFLSPSKTTYTTNIRFARFSRVRRQYRRVAGWRIELSCKGRKDERKAETSKVFSRKELWVDQWTCALLYKGSVATPCYYSHKCRPAHISACASYLQRFASSFHQVPNFTKTESASMYVLRGPAFERMKEYLVARCIATLQCMFRVQTEVLMLDATGPLEYTAAGPCMKRKPRLLTMKFYRSSNDTNNVFIISQSMLQMWQCRSLRRGLLLSWASLLQL